MQGWYIGITAASQAVKAGSTPVPCSTQLKRPMHSASGVFVLHMAARLGRINSRSEAILLFSTRNSLLREISLYRKTDQNPAEAENYGRSFVFRPNCESLGQMKNFFLQKKRIKVFVLQLLAFQPLKSVPVISFQHGKLIPSGKQVGI